MNPRRSPVALSLALLVASLVSMSASGTTFDPDPIALGDLVLPQGHPDQSIMKSLKVLYDPDNARVFAAGTVHGGVAVISLADPADPAYDRDWQLGRDDPYDDFETKMLAYDPDNDWLWVVGKTTGAAHSTSDSDDIGEHNVFVSNASTGEVIAETWNKNATHWPAAAGMDNPVGGIAMGSAGQLYAYVWDGRTDQKMRYVMLWEASASSSHDDVDSVMATQVGAYAGGGTTANEIILDMAWDPSSDVVTGGAMALLMKDEVHNKSFIRWVKPVSGALQNMGKCYVTQAHVYERWPGLLHVADNGKITVGGGHPSATNSASVATFTSNATGNCTLLASRDLDTQMIPERMAVNDHTSQVAFLYKFDETTQYTHTPYSGVQSFESWIDVYRDNGSSFTVPWHRAVGPHGESIKSLDDTSGLAFVLGIGGEGMVRFLPNTSTGAAIDVQLSMSPKPVVITENSAGLVRVLSASRLCGSQLVVSSTGGGTGCYYDADTTGYWPVAMVKSDSLDALFVLPQFDRTLRRFTLSDVADCSGAPSSISYTEIALPQYAPSRPPYQRSDALNAMAITPDGEILAALVNEAGELHIFNCASGTCVSEATLSYASAINLENVDAHPGRAQVAVRMVPHSTQREVYVYDTAGCDGDDSDCLRVWRRNNLTGAWTEDTSAYLLLGRADTDPDDDVDDSWTYIPSPGYGQTSLFYSPDTPNVLYLYDLVISLAGGAPTLDDIPTQDGDRFFQRVVGAEGDGALWVTSIDGATGNEHLRRISEDASGDWQTDSEYYLFDTFNLRSGAAMDLSSGLFRAAFSQPQDGKVHYRSTMPALNSGGAPTSPTCGDDTACAAREFPQGVSTSCAKAPGAATGQCAYALDDASEVLGDLQQLYKGAGLYRRNGDRLDATGGSLGCAYPAPQATTPLEGTCCASLGGSDDDGDGRCDAAPVNWTDDTWSEVGFNKDGQHGFLYAMETASAGVPEIVLKQDDEACSACQHELRLAMVEDPNDPCAPGLPAGVEYSFCDGGTTGAQTGFIPFTPTQRAGFQLPADTVSPNPDRAEAADHLQAILEGAVAHYAASCAFPPDQAVTPIEGTCCPGLGGPDVSPQDMRCDARPQNWTGPGWQAVGFSIDDDHALVYRYRTVGAGAAARFEAIAEGDRNCDQTRATFRRFARPVSTSAPCSAEIVTGIHAVNEAEGCGAACFEGQCGDGVVSGPEACDPGLHDDCTPACQWITAHAGQSNMVAASPRAADGASVSLVHVILKDALGQPLAGRAVEVSTDLGTLDDPQDDDTTVTTDFNGHAVILLSSDAVGTATVTVTDARTGQALPLSAQVAFLTPLPEKSKNTQNGAGQPMGLQAPPIAGGVEVDLTDLQWVDPDSLPDDGKPDTSTAQFTMGLIDFTAQVRDSTTGVLMPGQSIAFEITYPDVIPAGSAYWSYGPTPDNARPHWYQLPASRVLSNDGDATLTLVLTDGGVGDADRTANGIIVDPSGPGIPPAAPSGIPTLGEWAMILLGLLLVGVALRRLTPDAA